MVVPALGRLKISNTLSGKKESFETIEPGKVRFYSCGPTVYGLIHIGNLRASLTADLLYRYLIRFGYEVTYVRNYTDVDDKIIKRAAEEGITPESVARKYTSEAEKDYAMAGLAEPTHKPTVTGHIQEIIALIQQIIKNGLAYVAEDGEVLFAIDQFKEYGKLSHKPLEDLIAGIRVSVSDKKKNPLDFTLWKPAKPGEPYWESPWGMGRPGWHIECSAMAKRWLGDQIDIHHGGEDLIFPHHENEIAQSEAACGHAPFSRYWMHNGFLMMSKEKMSKSLGNLVSARDFLAQHGGEVTRAMLLSGHYRSPLDFSDDLVSNAIAQLERLYEVKAKALEIAAQKKMVSDPRAEALWGQFLVSADRARDEIRECYHSDLNTAGAMGSFFTLAREFNRTVAEPLAQATPSSILGAQQFLAVLEEEIGSVINVGRQSPEKALADLHAVRGRIRARQGATEGAKALPTEEEIQAAIQARTEARKAKDFAQADAIRKDLEARGVILKDSPTGTTWSYQ